MTLLAVDNVATHEAARELGGRLEAHNPANITLRLQ